MLVHKIIVEESKRIKEVLYSNLNYRLHFNPNHVHSHFSNYQAETSVNQYSNSSPSFDSSKPLAVKGD